MVKLFQDVVTIRLRSFFTSTPRPLSRGLLSTDLRLSTMMRCCSMRSGRLIKRVRILFFDRKFNYSTFNDKYMIMMQSSSIIWFKRCLKRSIFLFSCHLFNYVSLVSHIALKFVKLINSILLNLNAYSTYLHTLLFIIRFLLHRELFDRNFHPNTIHATSYCNL